MSWRLPSLPTAAGILAAAIAGAGLALGGAAIFGGFGGKTTTVREVLGGAGASPASFRDVAVLKVSAASRALTPLPLGDSDAVRVGDQVLAIGNPFGLDRTATAGIVSALQRPIQAPNGDEIDHVIQTDAALNHGNSGGPLIDASGRVIGVNSQIQTGGTTDGNVGIGFAIPINTVKTVVAQLIASGRVEHAFLGVNVRGITPDVARVFRLPVSHGLLVEG